MTDAERAHDERLARHYRIIQWAYPCRAYAIIRETDPKQNTDIRKWRGLGPK